MRSFAIVTALATATAAPAFASDSDEFGEDIQTQGHDFMEAEDHQGGDPAKMGVEAMMDDNGNMVVRGDTDQQVEDVVRTEPQVIYKAASQGAEIRSYRDELIGTVTGRQEVEGGADRIVVEVAKEAGLDAKRLAFGVTTLSIDQVNGLEFDYSVEQLKQMIADSAQG